MTERLTRQELRKLASCRAGLILESIMNGGWEPDDLIDRYGEDVVDELTSEIQKISRRLVRNSGYVETGRDDH